MDKKFKKGNWHLFYVEKCFNRKSKKSLGFFCEMKFCWPGCFDKSYKKTASLNQATGNKVKNTKSVADPGYPVGGASTLLGALIPEAVTFWKFCMSKWKNLDLAKKWVQNPLVSDVAIAIAIANAQWKQSYTFTYNPLKKHRYRCMETGH